MTRPTPLAALVPALMIALAAGTARADDTGDAPDGYGLAAHAVAPGGPYLGPNAPDDNDPVAGIAADGDDLANGDDEDGVPGFPALVQDAKAYGVDVLASNPTGAAVTLRGWIDFDGDGAFGADESTSLEVPAGAADDGFRLRWTTLGDVTTRFTGGTYARFRIASDSLSASDATGARADGEVEDYALEVEPDVDGDRIPDSADADNDNDGIPDTVEVVGIDTDADGTPDYLDTDSDGDGVPDFAEAGANPASPVDTDGDGAPDYLDTDSDDDGTPDGAAGAGDADGDGAAAAVEGDGDADGDGIANDGDLDADNDAIPDAIELGDGADPVDTDGDGTPDFLDLDSDNDGLADLVEGLGASRDPTSVDADGDGRIDDGLPVGANGYLDAFETGAESGTPAFAIVDTDADGARDYRDADSDGDGANDVVEIGLEDGDADGLVDGYADTDGDGVADALDDADGDGYADGAGSRAAPPLPDTDDDGVPDVRDPDAVGGPADDSDDAAAGADGGEDADGGDAGSGDGDGTATDDAADGAAGTGTTDGGTTTDADDDADADADADAGTDDAPADDDVAAEVRTGLDGGVGCSVAPTSAPADPLFALLLGGAGLWFARRRGAARGAAAARRVPETTV